MVTPNPHASLSTGCRLVATDGRALPLRSVDLEVNAEAGLAAVRLRQTFANPHAEPLEATYQLPLPADGAVVDFAFVIDGTRIQGRVERREDARQAFEDAVLQGRTAALLEQDRSSLFTQSLGNLPPGALIEVTIVVEQPLAWEDGGWAWRFPTVVAPRYLGDRSQTPDAAAIVVDVADAPPTIPCRFSLTLGEAAEVVASSPSHGLRTEGGVVRLLGALDRDVVVRWPAASLETGLRLERSWQHGMAHAVGLLTLVPPAPDAPQAPVPRDLILLLDTSGSMSGRPLAQMQAFCRALVGSLGEADQLQMVEFSNRVSRWKAEPVPMTAPERQRALQWIGSLVASGGTRMHDGILEALRPLREEATRQVVLMTDGLIGFEHEVVGHILGSLPRGCSVHTVGVGSAPNRSLTSAAARAGGGHEALVGLDEDVAPRVADLLARTSMPLITDVHLSGSALLGHAPARIPDLLASAPARIAVTLRPEGGTLIVTGRSQGGSVVHQIEVLPTRVGEGRRVVGTRAARERVEDLELELELAAGQERQPILAQIEALGLQARIATQCTSWVAATDQATVNPDDPTRADRVPQSLPHGMSAEGVGLRLPVDVELRGGGGIRMGGAVDRLQESASGVLGSVKRRRLFRRDESMAQRPVLPPAAAPAGDKLEAHDKEADDADGGMEVERIRIAAIVRRHARGRLVLLVLADRPLVWDTSGGVRVRTADGDVVVEIERATRNCTLKPGQRARLVVRWERELPALVLVGDLELELA